MEIVNLGRMGFYANSLVNNKPIKNLVSSTLETNNLITGLYEGFINYFENQWLPYYLNGMLNYSF